MLKDIDERIICENTRKAILAKFDMLGYDLRAASFDACRSNEPSDVHYLIELSHKLEGMARTFERRFK